MVSLALGRDPRIPHRAGPYAMAAKWYHRWFADGVVHNVPTPRTYAASNGRSRVRIDIVP